MATLKGDFDLHVASHKDACERTLEALDNAALAATCRRRAAEMARAVEAYGEMTSAYDALRDFNLDQDAAQVLDEEERAANAMTSATHSFRVACLRKRRTT